MHSPSRSAPSSPAAAAAAAAAGSTSAYRGGVPSLPQLPGFRPSPAHPSRLQHNFTYVNGYAIERPRVPRVHDPEVTLRAIAATRAGSRHSDTGLYRASAMATVPAWVADDRQVLEFTAYFKEAVVDSPHERYRVRRCQLSYYCEDRSIKVSEPRVENSGLPQGLFVKRHRVPKDTSSFLELEDLNVGEQVTIYGRVFHIVDCSPATREFLHSRGVHVPEPESVPDDPYTGVRASIMQRETGADSSVYRGILTNPMKTFAEAQLGKFVRPPGALGAFLKNDRKVLRFYCVWDDRSTMHGRLHRYKLHYNLADNTMDIVMVHEANSGEDAFDRLLARSRVARNYLRALPTVGTAAAAGAGDEEEYYTWRDLVVGNTLNVYGKLLHLRDCDPFTRRWFREEHGVEQPPAIPEEPAAAPVPKQPPAPYTPGTFGSEEDSLGSCASLMPKPAKRDLARLSEFDGKTLRFAARLAEPRVEDEGRTFVITYYLADYSVSVYEPPLRNSGILGGQFLRRTKVKRADALVGADARVELGGSSGSSSGAMGSSALASTSATSPTGIAYLQPADFAVSSQLRLAGHVFVITAVDAHSQRMLDGRERDYDSAEVSRIITKLVTKLRAYSTQLRRTFRQADLDKNNRITLPELRNMLRMYFTADDLTDQEVLTVLHYFDRDRNGSIDYGEFAAVVLGRDYGRTEFATTSEHGLTAHMRGEAAKSLELDYASRAVAEAQAEEREHRVARLLKNFSQAFINRKGLLAQTFRMLDTDFSGAVDRCVASRTRAFRPHARLTRIPVCASLVDAVRSSDRRSLCPAPTRASPCCRRTLRSWSTSSLRTGSTSWTTRTL